MKRKISVILIVVCVVTLLSGFTTPSHSNDFFVTDNANVLSSDTKSRIVSMGQQLQQECGAQIVVLTIPSLGDYGSIEEAARDVFDSWKIGQEGKDNGILFIFSVEDRWMRIEVGYGLEGILPDGKVGRIRDNYITNYFRDGDYDEGVLQGYRALYAEVATEYNIEPIPNETPVQSSSDNNSFSMLYMVLGIIGFFFIDGLFLRGSISRSLFRMFVLFGGNGRGGRGGGFGGGGGGFSGGGGRSGGGGASGRW